MLAIAIGENLLALMSVAKLVYFPELMAHIMLFFDPQLPQLVCCTGMAWRTGCTHLGLAACSYVNNLNR
jgi:hypothetical protein